MNIRVFLSDVAGSSEQDIELIEGYLQSQQPFGLACSRSMVIFLPAKEKGFWLWSDHSPGPTFQAGGWAEFVGMVKMQYLSHKRVLSTDEILAVTSILDYERKQQRLAEIRKGVLPQPGQPSGPVEIGAGGIQQGGVEGNSVPEPSGSPTDTKLLPEPICDAEDIPFDESRDGADAGG